MHIINERSLNNLNFFFFQTACLSLFVYEFNSTLIYCCDDDDGDVYDDDDQKVHSLRFNSIVSL